MKLTGWVGAGLGLYPSACVPAIAQDAPSLARAAKNPFSDVVNLQFIYDASPGMGAGNQTQHTLTLQPVIPFNVNPDWSIITRTVLPLIAQPGANPGDGWISGPGDTQLAFFLSPTHVEPLVWGVGPVFQLPTATNEALGQGKWGAGPAAGVQWMGEQWTVGALVTNIWSFAGDHSRPAVNQLEFQPQINYNFKSNPDRYLTFAPTITANWKASGSERWTVPLALGIGQLVKFGGQSVNLQASAYYNVVRPADAVNWTFELTVQFLFPK